VCVWVLGRLYEKDNQTLKNTIDGKKLKKGVTCRESRSRSCVALSTCLAKIVMFRPVTMVISSWFQHAAL